MRYSRYSEQARQWPPHGRHVLAQFDDSSIYVYQAYRPAIAEYAVEHQRFGGEFSFGRMSWIKTNFLWMMYRSGWGTKEGQERVLLIRLPRLFFDELLSTAVASTWDGEGDREAWRAAVGRSRVRMQWDPDHHPNGAPLERRALQLGLRGEVLRRYATEVPISIEDVSEFVAQQRERMGVDLLTPSEEVYQPLDGKAATNLKLDAWPGK